MSLFGTFRRTKGKKYSHDQPGMMTLDVSSSTSAKNSSVFSSTPNLHKIDQTKGEKLLTKLSTSEYDKNNDSPVANGSDHCGSGSSNSKWSFESRRSSNAETWTGSSPNSLPFKKNLSSSTSMRHFMSMMNVVGSLKRSKSIRLLGWGSTMNLSKDANNVPSSGGVQTNKALINSKSKSMTSSKSEEHLNDLPDSTDSKGEEILNRTIGEDGISIKSSNKNGIRDARNCEPGVISSGSSSENSSVHDSNSIRASSERSDIMEESDDEYMEQSVKNPEEIERIKTLLLGTKKFNMDPKKGIEFLVEKGVVNYTPDNVARFLKDGTGLGKKSIGNYLGERHDFNEEVLKSFVELHDFKNLILVQALRQFLWSFRLPGESQKISRMLDAFAERYCQNNPGMFSIDTCSVLCYSIIMLNTELHNPNVKEKATVDQFIKRNRGIEGGELLSPSFMISLYNSIQTEPFRFPEEDGNDLMLTFFNPDYEGWLYKLGGRPKSWKRLWFILSNNCLYFFKFTTDKTPRGIIPLENILVKIAPDKHGSKLYIFILFKESPDPKMVDQIKTCKTLSDGQTVPKLYSSIQLGTQVRKERIKWVRAINANHSMSSFYSDLTLKKMKAKSSQNLVETRPVVRKSQISLPATVLGNEIGDELPIPDIVLQDPTKDPKNFFIQRNLSSISLASSVEPEVDLIGTRQTRSRSRSDSRLNEYGLRSNSKSPSMSSTKSHQEDSQDQDLDVTLTADNVTNNSAINSFKKPSPLKDLSPNRSKGIKTGAKIELRTEPIIYDKIKKLSMIQEQMRSGSFSSENESSEPTQFSYRKLIEEPSSVYLRKTSRSSSVEKVSSESQESLDNSEIPYNQFPRSDSDTDSTPPVLPNVVVVASSDTSYIPQLETESPIVSRRKSLTNKTEFEVQDRENLNYSSINVNNCHNCSIEIIDCSNPDVKSKSFSTSTTGLQIDSEKHLSQSLKVTKVPEMCFDNIYESNV